MGNKNPQQKLKIELDKLTRQLAIKLANGRCEHCHSERVLQANHIIPRTVLGLRWDVTNIVILCRKCHLYWWHKDIIGAYEWIKNIRDLNWLKRRRAIIENRKGNPDLKMIKIYLEQQLRGF